MTCIQWELHKLVINERIDMVKRNMTILKVQVLFNLHQGNIAAQLKGILSKVHQSCFCQKLTSHLWNYAPFREQHTSPTNQCHVVIPKQEMRSIGTTEFTGDKFGWHQSKNLHLPFIQLLDTNIITCQIFWQCFSGQECFFKKFFLFGNLPLTRVGWKLATEVVFLKP